MKKLVLLVLIALVLNGCQTTEKDPRPPLMNTNAFSNFQPFTNEVDEFKIIDSILNNVSNELSTDIIELNQHPFTSRIIFRIRHTEEVRNGTIQ